MGMHLAHTVHKEKCLPSAGGDSRQPEEGDLLPLIFACRVRDITESSIPLKNSRWFPSNY